MLRKLPAGAFEQRFRGPVVGCGIVPDVAGARTLERRHRRPPERAAGGKAPVALDGKIAVRAVRRDLGSGRGHERGVRKAIVLGRLRKRVKANHDPWISSTTKAP